MDERKSLIAALIGAVERLQDLDYEDADNAQAIAFAMAALARSFRTEPDSRQFWLEYYAVQGMAEQEVTR